MTRQTKTPQQRAEEALAVATRKVTRLEEQHSRLATELAETAGELAEATRMRDYLAQSPALPTGNRRVDPAGTTPTQEEGTQE